MLALARRRRLLHQILHHDAEEPHRRDLVTAHRVPEPLWHVRKGSDNTPVPVLDPGAGKTKTGRLWTYVRDDRPAGDETPQAVWFRYSPDRKGLHPHRHLKSFRGVLQADAFAGFNALYGERIVEAGCWAHVRRKFYDLAQAGPSPAADEALQRIAVLYRIEAGIRGQPSARRQVARQARAGPLLEELKTWMQATLSQVSTKSGLMEANGTLARVDRDHHPRTRGKRHSVFRPRAP